MGSVVVLAPHVDDEVIGCYRLLAAGKVAAVYYAFELTAERMKEAARCAEMFGFEARKLDWWRIGAQLPHDATVLVPHDKDHHPWHKFLNYQTRMLRQKRVCYSVDMNATDVVELPYEASRAKHRTLVTLFPSQSDYFARFPRCYSFERNCGL